MALAKSAGEKYKALSDELDTLIALESPTQEDTDKASKLNDDVKAARDEFTRLRAIDDATDARKAEDAQEAAKQRVPVNRPNLQLVPTDPNKPKDVTPVGAKSWSDQFIESAVYKSIHSQGHYTGASYSVTLDDAIAIKAAGDPILATQFGTRYTDTRLVAHAFPPSNIIPLVNVVNITATNVRYYQATMPIVGAGPDWTAEAAAKPEIQPRWAAVDAPIETLAEWTAVTLQALDDVPQLRAVLDFDLRRALENKLDDSLLNGSGTTPVIRGILNVSGVQTVAFVATTSQQDMIAKGIAAVSATGYGTPNAVVMNPADWWAMRANKATTGNYLFGDPTGMGIPNVWGVPVVADAHLAAGTALVGDFSYATFYQRMGVTFIVGLKNDDLIKNLTTIVCEMRGTLAVTRPQAFAKVALV